MAELRDRMKSQRSDLKLNEDHHVSRGAWRSLVTESGFSEEKRADDKFVIIIIIFSDFYNWLQVKLSLSWIDYYTLIRITESVYKVLNVCSPKQALSFIQQMWGWCFLDQSVRQMWAINRQYRTGLTTLVSLFLHEHLTSSCCTLSCPFQSVSVLTWLLGHAQATSKSVIFLLSFFLFCSLSCCRWTRESFINKVTKIIWATSIKQARVLSSVL